VNGDHYKGGGNNGGNTSIQEKPKVRDIRSAGENTNANRNGAMQVMRRSDQST
jgi:hypothetical protein